MRETERQTRERSRRGLPAMLRLAGKWSVVCGLAIAAIVAIAAEPDLPETWNDGSTANWVCYDPLSKTTGTLTNPGDFLRVRFRTQGTPFPQIHVVTATLTASDGQFAGQYWRKAITNVSFKLRCDKLQPADLRVYIANSTSSNWWYYMLPPPTVDEWTDYSVPVSFDAGWRMLNGTSAQFKKDMQNAEWIGVLIERNSSTAQQLYDIDDFVLKGSSKVRDRDGDGRSDWAEFIAGTDDGDFRSTFKVDISFTNTPSGKGRSVLKWQSAKDRKYTIKRTTDLRLGFPETRKKVQGKPSKTWYEDDASENGRVYFYKIEVE